MNIEQIRKDTPGCSDKLFLNSAGSSLMPAVVVEKMNEYVVAEEKIGGYKLAELRAAEINGFYVEAARLINCKPENIAFTFNASDAYAKALSSIPFQPGDVIITTDDDYVSNHINFISLHKRFGVRIERIRNLKNGELDMTHFKQLVKKHKPKLVAVTHVPMNSGLIQQVEKIGAVCAKHKIIFLLDACQSVGQIEVDVKKIKCDFLSVTGRKFLRGPRGTGFLFVSDRMLNENYSPLFVDLRGATWTETDDFEIGKTARRFETWELPYTLLIGLKEAIGYVNRVGIKNIQTYNQKLRARLKKNLLSIPGVTLLDKGVHNANILTFRKKGKSLDAIKTKLDKHNVYYSVSLKSNALLDFRKKKVDWAIRLSPHYFNTLDEMDRVAKIIKEI